MALHDRNVVLPSQGNPEEESGISAKASVNPRTGKRRLSTDAE
jgi:hypothetical protein